MVTFKGARRPGQATHRATGKLQSKPKLAGAGVAPYGKTRSIGIGEQKGAVQPGKGGRGNASSIKAQMYGRRAPSDRTPLTEPSDAPSPVQIELTCAFDSEHGFTEGLYDIDSNTLYV
jgi:hypothetical protein